MAQCYNFLRLGKQGDRNIHQARRDTATYPADEIGKMGPFDIIYDGSDGIPALSWTLKDDVNHGFTLFDLVDRLRTRGWLVPAYTMPANREDLAIQRILCRHGFGRDMADLLLEDYRQAVAHLDKHPASVPLTEDEAGGFTY